MAKDINYDIQYVGKIKTAFFGGKALFSASLQGPGTVWIRPCHLADLQIKYYLLYPLMDIEKMKEVY